MRKLFIVGLCLILSGCMRIDEVIETDKKDKTTKEPEIQEQDDTEKTLVCTNETDEEITFEAQGDQLKKMKQIFYMTFEDLGITEEMDKAQMEQTINTSLANSYAKINGVDVVGTLEESRVKITIEIDYDVADTDELIEAGLLHEGEVETQYISFKTTEEDYKNNGYACKEE